MRIGQSYATFSFNLLRCSLAHGTSLFHREINGIRKTLAERRDGFLSTQCPLQGVRIMIGGTLAQSYGLRQAHCVTPCPHGRFPFGLEDNNRFIWGFDRFCENQRVTDFQNPSHLGAGESVHEGPGDGRRRDDGRGGALVVTSSKTLRSCRAPPRVSGRQTETRAGADAMRADAELEPPSNGYGALLRRRPWRRLPLRFPGLRPSRLRHRP